MRADNKKRSEAMASTDDYKRLAAECLRIARESQNPNDRAMLLRMAEAWIRLAERASARQSAEPNSPAAPRGRARQPDGEADPMADKRGQEGS
jgi:Tfp pilus assembly protein PilX